METSEDITISENEVDSSSDMDVETDEILPKSNATLAEQTKNSGNDEYKAQNYQAALKLYSDAISLSPETAAYYGNRAACHIMLGNYVAALNDARTSIQIDENFEKGYVRIAKCCLLLGDIIGTEQAIKKLLEIDPNNTSAKTEQQNCIQLRQFEQKIQDFYDRKVYRTVVFFLDSALKIAPACLKYKLLKAECLAFLGRIEEAGDIAITAMKIDTSSADAVYVRGLCLYFNDNVEKGIIHFERALQLDPDHTKAKEMRIKSKNVKEKKEKGNILFKSGKYREAQILYSEALEIDPLNQEINSKLYYNRALVSSKIGNLRDAVTDCTKVLEIKDSYLKALLLRARCYNDLENYEDSVRDYESALKLQKTPDIKKMLRDAKIALKRSKTRKDYYKILGIPKNASDDEIKKAYRKKALAHHPDRHVSSSEIDKKEEERKFKEIGEAYAVLSDPQKKMCHDTGQDIDDDQPEVDPEQMFRHFFQFSDNNGFRFEF